VAAALRLLDRRVADLAVQFLSSAIDYSVYGAPFDFFGILGLLSLAGIIINNGIVLIDRIDIERNAGRDPYDAVVEATVSRFRPICMTTITTILGVMPLIISQDAVFYSLAIIIAAGLAFGTVLTLGVVPVLYSVLFRVRANQLGTRFVYVLQVLLNGSSMVVTRGSSSSEERRTKCLLG
jgi:Cu/Ag efflux pump CusA